MNDEGNQAKDRPEEPSGAGAPSTFDADHPLVAGITRDRLGFSGVARALASSLVTQDNTEGLVVSIEGEWGSGKSSLVNLLASELFTIGQSAPEVVRFEPWLVGDRDTMLLAFISDLAIAVDRIQQSDATPDHDRETTGTAVGGMLRKYGSMLVPIFKAIPTVAGAAAAAATESPAAGAATEAAAQAAINQLETRLGDIPESISHQKKELADALRSLDRNVVVIVDDLDRLEPREAAEVIRLIKSVANFPRVQYVLCYAPRVLARALTVALDVDDGQAFIEKIVQVRFTVPQPEAFDLRLWLLEELRGLHQSCDGGSPLSHEQVNRLERVCDTEGELLSTPRDVVRILNAVKLHWPPISREIDFPDLVWLQIVRIDNEALYLWIQNYLTEYSAVAAGAWIESEQKVQFYEELEPHLPPLGAAARFPNSLWRLSEILPGISPLTRVKPEERLFNECPHAAQFEQGRRLGSPQHSRYYFAFCTPAGALADQRLEAIMSTAQAGNPVEHSMLALAQETRPQGGTLFDVLVTRLARRAQPGFPISAARSIVLSLGNCMDEIDVGSPLSGSSWSRSTLLFERLLERLIDTDRTATLNEMYSTGRAIGWLMDETLRPEFFRHGWCGDEHSRPEETWTLNEEELVGATQLLQQRFRQTDRERLIDTPRLLLLLIGWKQSGDEEGVSEWVASQISTPEGLVKLLDRCRQMRTSHGNPTYPIRREDMELFLDFDQAMQRLLEIAEDETLPKAIRTKAAELRAHAA